MLAKLHMIRVLMSRSPNRAWFDFDFRHNSWISHKHLEQYLCLFCFVSCGFNDRPSWTDGQTDAWLCTSLSLRLYITSSESLTIDCMKHDGPGRSVGIAGRSLCLTHWSTVVEHCSNSLIIHRETLIAADRWSVSTALSTILYCYWYRADLTLKRSTGQCRKMARTFKNSTCFLNRAFFEETQNCC